MCAESANSEQVYDFDRGMKPPTQETFDEIYVAYLDVNKRLNAGMLMVEEGIRQARNPAEVRTLRLILRELVEGPTT